MWASFVRHSVGTVWWLGIATIGILANLWAVVEHYLNAKNALELAGTEKQPLWRDELVGRLLGAFMPDASLANALAVTVSVLEALALFILFHELFHVIELMRHRRSHQAAENVAEVDEAKWRIIESLTLMGILGVFLVFAISFDVELFRFRALAVVLGVGDSDVVPARDHVVSLANIGAYGYLAFTAIGALLLDWSFQKLDDRCTLLLALVEPGYQALRSGTPSQTDEILFYGYDSDGQPVYDSNTPIAYDTNGNAIATFDATANDQAPTTPPAAPRAEQAAAQPPGQSSAPSADSPVTPPPPAGVSPAAEGEMVDVIGGTDGQRIRLADALADSNRYYVDPTTGWVWNGPHWEALRGMASGPETKAA